MPQDAVGYNGMPTVNLASKIMAEALPLSLLKKYFLCVTSSVTTAAPFVSLQERGDEWKSGRVGEWESESVWDIARV